MVLFLSFEIEGVFKMGKLRFFNIFTGRKNGDLQTSSVEMPDERLRVFISSAQSNEGGFAWSDVRRRIKDYLKECPYLNPFIIEDDASPMQSEQRYQRQLLRADIVVLLVKGEVRKGTATEYALATKHKKPMLIYFLDDGTLPELSAVELKRNVQITDYCTYCSMPSFDGIEKTVRKNVIESIICYFQDQSLHCDETNADTEIIPLPNEVSQTKHSIPTKTDIGLFGSSYSHIFDLLNIPQIKRKEVSKKSALHDLGVAALDWLVTGKNSITDDDVLKLIENVSSLYTNTEWLIRRWDAIRHELAGDINGALKAEGQALSLARASEMPPWIIANILIDCRNMENDIFNRDGNMFVEGDSQKGLNELDTIVYLPILDRYLGNVYNGLSKEIEKFKTAKPGTVFFGTNIGSIINDVENYFFTALLYGSYTHMLISRDLLFRVLYQYDELTSNKHLLFESIKLLVLSGNEKSFKKILDYKWDDAYLSVTTSADELWQLSNRIPGSSSDSMKRAVLTKIGMYMTDECFAEAEAYLKSRASSVWWGISEDFFDCIFQNINRLSATSVVEMLTEIISKQHFHLGGKLSNILLHLDTKDVPRYIQEEFCKVLEENLTFIVSNGGHPQFIAALVIQNKDVFEALASVPDNGLTGTQKLFYDINTGCGDWSRIFIDQIDTARQQFDVNKKPGSYTGFAERPYATIKSIVREHYTSEIKGIINEKLLPLCIDVLGSKAPADVKEDCIDCLCDVLVYSKPDDINLSVELVNAIANIDISETYSFMGSSKSVLSCRMLMLRIITGAADKDEMLEWCFDFVKKDRSTKVALAECIEQYLCRYADDPEKIDAMIFSIVLQCFEDDYWPVRRMACNCLVKMLVTKYKDRIECKLYEGAIDPSHYVRNHLLHMCCNGEIEDVSISERIIDIMKKDANYAIREFANS